MKRIWFGFVHRCDVGYNLKLTGVARHCSVEYHGRSSSLSSSFKQIIGRRGGCRGGCVRCRLFGISSSSSSPCLRAYPPRPRFQLSLFLYCIFYWSIFEPGYSSSSYRPLCSRSPQLWPAVISHISEGVVIASLSILIISDPGPFTSCRIISQTHSSRLEVICGLLPSRPTGSDGTSVSLLVSFFLFFCVSFFQKSSIFCLI